MPELLKKKLLFMGYSFLMRIIIVIICITSISSFSQESPCQVKLIGEWEVYNFSLPYRRFNVDSSKHLNVWKFDKDSIKIGSNAKVGYRIYEECIRLIFDYEEEVDFLIRKFDNDSLKIEYRVAPHESFVYCLKKLNKNVY